MTDDLETYLAFLTPKCVPAQTYHDHEEWSRFYLALLTDPEYIKHRLQQFGGPWSNDVLIKFARQHMEAARILKELDELHD